MSINHRNNPRAVILKTTDMTKIGHKYQVKDQTITKDMRDHVSARAAHRLKIDGNLLNLKISSEAPECAVVNVINIGRVVREISRRNTALVCIEDLLCK